MTTPPSSGILQYASSATKSRRYVDYASARRARLPSPIVATLLQLPGLYCWIVFVCLIFDVWPMLGFSVFARVTLLAWPVAVITAIISMGLYIGKTRRRPWYVCVNLAVNISGVAFTLVILLIGLLQI
jgi:hypothetical protein